MEGEVHPLEGRYGRLKFRMDEIHNCLSEIT